MCYLSCTTELLFSGAFFCLLSTVARARSSRERAAHIVKTNILIPFSEIECYARSFHSPAAPRRRQQRAEVSGDDKKVFFFCWYQQKVSLWMLERAENWVAAVTRTRAERTRLSSPRHLHSARCCAIKIYIYKPCANFQATRAMFINISACALASVAPLDAW